MYQSLDFADVYKRQMEKLRANMIVFHYQLRHIGRGKQRMKEYIHAVQAKLVRYTELVQEIRDKSKERKSLLAEKKETPLYLSLIHISKTAARSLSQQGQM